MKILIDNQPYFSVSILQGKFKHLKIGNPPNYFSLVPEKPLQKTMKFVKNNEILYLSNKLTDYVWNFTGTYELEHVNFIVKGEVTTDYCMKCNIHFYSAPQPYGSHRGWDSAHKGTVTVKVINQQGQELSNETTTLWTWLGGDSKGNANKDLDILNKEFNEPVKIIYSWSLDLGGYAAHAYGGQVAVSVVRDIKMDIICD